MIDKKFEPKILGLMCNWCSYAGADLAGVSRTQYPSNIRIVRVMCSGRIDPIIVFEAFSQGIDGVLIAGCHPGDCHYLSGNYQAEKKVKITAKLLDLAGIETERFRLEWLSASEGGRFATVVTEFTNQIRALGPNKLNPEKLEQINAARDAITFSRLRTLVGMEITLTEKGDVFGNKRTQADFDSMLDAITKEEYIRARILQSIKNKALSVKEIAKKIAIPSDKVFRHVLRLKKKGLLIIERIEGEALLYLCRRD